MSVLKRWAVTGLRILLAFVALATVLSAALIGYLFFYSADLPDTKELAAFTSDGYGRAVDVNICGETARITVVPVSQTPTLRAAVIAAEGDLDPKGVVSRLYDDLHDGSPTHQRYGTYSFQIARQLFCNERRVHKRQLGELRAATQLERKFSGDALLDIYVNSVYFGPGIYGIENAARHYFRKPAPELSIAEAALLSGLIRSPKRFSPKEQPDRAFSRRNDVIDAMLQRGSISVAEADEAKRTSLGIVNAP